LLWKLWMWNHFCWNWKTGQKIVIEQLLLLGWARLGISFSNCQTASVSRWVSSKMLQPSGRTQLDISAKWKKITKMIYFIW
jgi:hypothetical protein